MRGRPKHHSPWIGVALSAMGATASFAAPCPECSTIPDCIYVCPQGDMAFELFVGADGGYPTEGLPVLLDFGACSSFAPCLLPTGSYAIDPVRKRITGTTDLSGAILFPIAMGGVCPANQVVISSQNVELARRGLGSPDRNGDQVVGEDDVAAVQALIGQHDPTADFDCDGVVGSADVEIVRAHLGHHCAGVTGAKPLRWGTLKLRYR